MLRAKEASLALPGYGVGGPGVHDRRVNKRLQTGERISEALLNLVKLQESQFRHGPCIALGQANDPLLENIHENRASRYTLAPRGPLYPRPGWPHRLRTL